MKYFQRSLRPAERPVRGPRRFWLGALLILIVALAVGAWAELKAPEIPEDMKYRYTKHSRMVAELQLDFTNSLTPEQRELADTLGKAQREQQKDQADISKQCGEKFTVMLENWEPTCKPKEVPKDAKKK